MLLPPEFKFVLSMRRVTSLYLYFGTQPDLYEGLPGLSQADELNLNHQNDVAVAVCELHIRNAE
jgi:hypothetical protein